MQEWQLYSVWEHYAQTNQQLICGKNRLQILHAGELNLQEGPDYTGARFILNGVQYCGFVEIHVDADDWYRHQHHLDPAYQHVLLHIVSVKPETVSTVDHTLTDKKIPTFRIVTLAAQQKQFTCEANKIPPDITSRLQELALKRFHYKVHQFEKNLQLTAAEQLFNSAFFRALGYPNNKNIFEMLSQRVSLAINTWDPSEQLAVLLGTAGFLNTNFQDTFARFIQSIFAEITKTLCYAPIQADKWRMAGVRPLNHPQFRIAGWVALINTQKSISILDYFYGILQERKSFPATFKALNDILKIPTDSYWRSHYALDKELSGQSSLYYFGAQRIKEITTNLFLPFAAARAQRNKNPGFISYLEEFFLWIPGNSFYSSILRRKPWLKTYLDYWKSFNAGQAFLELETNFCRAGLCSHCPIGRKRVQ